MTDIINRDVRSHYLFEIATEVANRGMKISQSIDKSDLR